MIIILPAKINDYGADYEIKLKRDERKSVLKCRGRIQLPLKVLALLFTHYNDCCVQKFAKYFW